MGGKQQPPHRTNTSNRENVTFSLFVKEIFWAMIAALAIAILLTLSVSQAAYYLPGVTPNAFQDGETVSFVLCGFWLMIFEINCWHILFFYIRYHWKPIRLFRRKPHSSMITMICPSASGARLDLKLRTSASDSLEILQRTLLIWWFLFHIATYLF